MINFNRVQFLQSYGTVGQLPLSNQRELVICGRSNVGKSSLINRLCNRKKLAKVSSTPGKTTTINFFSLGPQAVLVDLPGYGYAKRSDSEKRRWGQLMEHYFASGRDIALVLLLLDSRHAPSEDDIVMLDFLCQSGVPFAAVLTKTDKLTKTQFREQVSYFENFLQDYAPETILPFSINDGASVDLLRNLIDARL